MTRLEKKTIEGYIDRAKGFIMMAHQHKLPLACLECAEDCLRSAEKILEKRE